MSDPKTSLPDCAGCEKPVDMRPGYRYGVLATQMQYYPSVEHVCVDCLDAIEDLFAERAPK